MCQPYIESTTALSDDGSGGSDVASGIDRHPDITEIYFRLQIQGNRSSSLVSILFREVFSHPYISFFIY